MQNDIFNEIIGTTKQTFDKLQEGGVDVIAVYFFYYSTAKWQKTNQPRATTSFVVNGLGICENRVRKAKKFLVEAGLIQDVRTKGKDGKVKGWFVKLNYIFKSTTLADSTMVVQPQGGKRSTNALSINNKMLKEKKQKYMDFVFLSDSEYKKLSVKMGEQLDSLVDDLNSYIGAKGVKYKSHYHVLLSWHKKRNPAQAWKKMTDEEFKTYSMKTLNDSEFVKSIKSDKEFKRRVKKVREGTNSIGYGRIIKLTGDI